MRSWLCTKHVRPEALSSCFSIGLLCPRNRQGSDLSIPDLLAPPMCAFESSVTGLIPMASGRVLALRAQLDAARDKLDAELDKEAPRDNLVAVF